MLAAMPDTLQVTLITPEREVLDQAAASVVIPAHDGLMGFLPGRAPILTQLGDGPMRITPAPGSSAPGTSAGGAEQRWHIAGGFAQMKDNRLTVLAESAESAEPSDD
jgi:F-type H+-transporting ATPase subunit epsilon